LRVICYGNPDDASFYSLFVTESMFNRLLKNGHVDYFLLVNEGRTHDRLPFESMIPSISNGLVPLFSHREALSIKVFALSTEGLRYLGLLE